MNMNTKKWLSQARVKIAPGMTLRYLDLFVLILGVYDDEEGAATVAYLEVYQDKLEVILKSKLISTDFSSFTDISSPTKVIR